MLHIATAVFEGVDMLKGFRDFIMRGNVVDLAIAVIMGSAFTAIVNSLVTNIINPIISATVGKPNFSYLVLELHGGKILYGDFLNSVISFSINATVVYFGILVPMNAFMRRLHPTNPEMPTTKSCPECLSEVPLAAKRCSHCAQVVALNGSSADLSADAKTSAAAR
jgi:large conductance mechanosensitive channel